MRRTKQRTSSVDQVDGEQPAQTSNQQITQGRIRRNLCIVLRYDRRFPFRTKVCGFRINHQAVHSTDTPRTSCGVACHRRAGRSRAFSVLRVPGISADEESGEKYAVHEIGRIFPESPQSFLDRRRARRKMIDGPRLSLPLFSVVHPNLRLKAVQRFPPSSLSNVVYKRTTCFSCWRIHFLWLFILQ